MNRMLMVVTLLFPCLQGCVAVLPYSPKQGLVDEVGFPEVKKQMAELLTRSKEPKVVWVDVTPDYLHYRTQHQMMGMFYQTVPTLSEAQLYFANIARLEVYENNYVFIWAPNDSRVDKILFADQNDAKVFADLLTSLKATRSKGGDAAAPPSK